jgi:hypothetical protein
MAALRVMETVSISACLNAAYEEPLLGLAQLLQLLATIAATSGALHALRADEN